MNQTIMPCGIVRLAAAISETTPDKIAEAYNVPSWRCPYCGGRYFSLKYQYQRKGFCSDYCFHKGIATYELPARRVPIACDSCGEVFLRRESQFLLQIRHGQRYFFCSRKCKDQFLGNLLAPIGKQKLLDYYEKNRPRIEARRSQATTLKELGYRPKAIAKITGYNRNTVYMQFGPFCPSRRSRAETAREAQGLIDKGFKLSQIAEQMGLSKNTIRYYLWLAKRNENQGSPKSCL